MRVTCQTVDEFCQCLLDAIGKGHSVADGTARFSKLIKSEGNRRDAPKVEISVHVSAIVQMNEGGDYLLEVEERCGTDYQDASQEYAGSERADSIKDNLATICQDAGCVVMPGIIGY